MSPRRPKGSWYPPGVLYDLAFNRMLRGLRRRVTAFAEAEGLYPWLDVCCGTGAQLRDNGQVQSRGQGSLVRVPIPSFYGGNRLAIGLDLSYGLIRYAAAHAPQVPFICGDAARLPFKDGSIPPVSVSFSLHDKSPELRTVMLAEARRVMAPNGGLIAVGFENPWNTSSESGRFSYG